MFEYRITKYNPIYRNERGAFIKDEWISYSDIGRKFNDKILSKEDYLKFENAYVAAIDSFMKCLKLTMLEVSNLEKREEPSIDSFESEKAITLYNRIYNNQQLNEDEVGLTARMVLRNNMWCKLRSRNMFVHFGYDYYMYIGSLKECSNIISEIEKSGLFVEKFQSPYHEEE